MRFSKIKINKTSLYHAVEGRNLKIIELLLQRPDIDVNQKSI